MSCAAPARGSACRDASDWPVLGLLSRTGGDCRRPCGAHCGGESRHVVGTAMATPVDEERRSARDSTGVGAHHILVHAWRIAVLAQLLLETLDVQAEVFGVVP